MTLSRLTAAVTLVVVTSHLPASFTTDMQQERTKTQNTNEEETWRNVR